MKILRLSLLIKMLELFNKIHFVPPYWFINNLYKYICEIGKDSEFAEFSEKFKKILIAGEEQLCKNSRMSATKKDDVIIFICTCDDSTIHYTFAGKKSVKEHGASAFSIHYTSDDMNTGFKYSLTYIFYIGIINYLKTYRMVLDDKYRSFVYTMYFMIDEVKRKSSESH